MYRKITVFFVGILATLLILTFTWDVIAKKLEILNKFNYVFYDTNLKLFHKKGKPTDILLVDIDEKSLQAEGRWPWQRSKLATLVTSLQNGGAAVIVFDILFPEVEPNIVNTLLSHIEQQKDAPNEVVSYLTQQLPFFDNDKIFANTLTKSDVVLGVFFNGSLYHTTGKLGKPLTNIAKPEGLVISRQDRYIGDIPVLADAVRYSGFTTTAPDNDGVIRRSPLLIEYNGELYPSLALETVKAYWLTDKVSLDLHDLNGNKLFLGVTVSDTYIPTDAAGNVLVTYRGPAFSFPYVSATDVIHNKLPPQTFAGKIVFIGSSAVGIGDLHATPLQAVGYPGTEVHATIVASILEKDVIASPLWLVGVERVLIMVIGLAVTFFAVYFSALTMILLTILMMVLLFAFNAILLVKWCLILPHLMLPYMQMLFLGLVNSVFGYLFETRQRQRLHDVYGQYVSSAHIDRMLESHGKHTLTGNTKLMTVLFADVRGFTSISEKFDAREVKKFLNTLFTPMTSIIFEYKGTIDKYVGDMIMAFWNDPVEDKEHAAHGVRAALKMQEKVRELAPIFAEQKLDGVAIRIGINTGMMHVGDMGSEYRKAYTVLGDSVNLASRLEGVNKMYGTSILVSEATKELCQGVVFRFVDCIYVKGKAKPTKIYEPLCLLSEKSSTVEEELTEYERALELYNTDNWCQALESFTKLVEKYPQVGVYDVYAKRVAQYKACPPAPDWDRGQHLTEK